MKLMNSFPTSLGVNMVIAIALFAFFVGITVGMEISSEDVEQDATQEREMLEMDLALPPPTYMPAKEA